MPKIPTVQHGSTQLVNPKVSTQSPSARQTQTIGSGKGISELGSSIQQTAGALYQKMDAARRYADDSKARVYKTQYLADLMVEEDERRDKNSAPLTDENISDFLEKANQGKEELKKIYRTKDGLLKAQMDWDYDVIVASNKILEQRRKNNAIVAKVKDDITLQNLALQYNGSPEAKKEIDDIFAAEVKNDIRDSLEAHNEKKRILKSGNWNWFRRIAKVDRDKAKQMVNNGDFGFDQKETDTALSTLVHYKTLEDKDTLLNKINSRYDIVEAIVTGQEDLYELSPQAQIVADNDEVLAEALVKARQTKRGYYAEKVDEGFVEIFKQASEAIDRDQLSTLALSTIYKNPNLHPDKLGAILFYARKKAINLQLSEKIISPIGDETTEAEMAQKQTDAGVNAISRWAKSINAPYEYHAQAIAEFMKGVQSGEKPIDIVLRVIRDSNLRLHPEMVNYPDEGQMIIDNLGNQKIAFPTGDIKPVSIKKKPIMKKPTAETEISKELPSFEELKAK